jgi:RNA polymerase sigma-70 factor (ECF subfamily)
MDDGSQTVSQEILDAVRGGDQGASRALIDMLYPQVISIVRNHLPRSEAEEDIVQDVFMKVFSKMKSYAGRQPFGHWVSRIALNTCYDRLRRQKRRRVVGFSELGMDEAEFLELAMVGEAPRPREGGPRLARELLDMLLAALKPRERMVVRMLDLEEKSVAEVCGLTGWGESKVRVSAMRARRKLGETLARLEGRSEES